VVAPPSGKSQIWLHNYKLFLSHGIKIISVFWCLKGEKHFLKFILTQRSTAPSYNMVLIITSIKSTKPSFPTTPYIQRLVSLHPISINVVSLYNAYLCVCVSACACFMSVCDYCFFISCSYSSIQLFSCKPV